MAIMGRPKKKKRSKGDALTHTSVRISDRIKQALVKAGEYETNLIFRTLHNTGRVLKTAVSDQVVAMEQRPGGCTFEDIRPLVSGQRGRVALETGDMDAGLVWAGQVVGLIDDVPSCEELINRMVAQCRERLALASAVF